MRLVADADETQFQTECLRAFLAAQETLPAPIRDFLNTQHVSFVARAWPINPSKCHVGWVTQTEPQYGEAFFLDYAALTRQETAKNLAQRFIQWATNFLRHSSTSKEEK